MFGEIIVPNTYDLRSYGIMWIKLLGFNNGQSVHLEIEHEHGTWISESANSYQELHHNVEFELLNGSRIPVDQIRLLMKVLEKNRKLIENGIKELTRE